MGYKLKTHSGAAKRFKKTGSSVKSKSANRNHILTKQSTNSKNTIPIYDQCSNLAEFLFYGQHSHWL